MIDDRLHFGPGDQMPLESQPFRKTAVVEMVRMERPFSCTSREGHDLHGQAGDFLAADGHGGFYPVSAEFHAANYEPAQETHRMTFGDALEALKAGKRVSRTGWSGKGMFLFLMPATKVKVCRPPLPAAHPGGEEAYYRPYIAIKDAQSQIVPWLASQTDMLADDWMIVD